MRLLMHLVACAGLTVMTTSVGAAPLTVAVFNADVSPPVGSPLAYTPTREVLTPLTARGVVLRGSGRPIVLCAVDWIGMANGGYAEWRSAVAEAAGTSVDRVALHALHLHDAPRCDFTVEALLEARGIGGVKHDDPVARRAIRACATAVKQSLANARTVTHIGLGKGEVKQVASNRRVLGADGKIRYWRGSTTRDAAARAEPEGLIDPYIWAITFYDDAEPIAVLQYYATHPMSYYRTGQASTDFVGMARATREQATGVPHIYFTGAGGNVAAGKYNDGAHANRNLFADRLASGMRRAWESTQRYPIDADDVGWRVERVALPPAAHLVEPDLRAVLDDSRAGFTQRFVAACELAWLKRHQAGDTTEISCLRVGKARVLHLCGELFVEYQLAAQRMRPDLFVTLAAYGEYGPGYIGTRAAYSQGGYEVEPRSSRVGPESEVVLMEAMGRLLEGDR